MSYKTEEIFTLEITMKSGAKVEAEVLSAEYSRDQYGGRTLSWETPEFWKTKILHVSMDEVAAVIVKDRTSRRQEVRLLPPS